MALVSLRAQTVEKHVSLTASLVKKGIFPSPEIISPMPPKVVCSWVNIAWATDGF